MIDKIRITNYLKDNARLVLDDLGAPVNMLVFQRKTMLNTILGGLFLITVLIMPIERVAADDIGGSYEQSMLASNTYTGDVNQRFHSSGGYELHQGEDTRIEKLERSREILHRLMLILFLGAVPPFLYVLMKMRR